MSLSRPLDDPDRAQARTAYERGTAGYRGSLRTVNLHDKLGPRGVSAAELIAELDSEPGPVELRVCSPGGAPDAALAIFGSMRRRLWPVRVVVDGWAASSATIILMGATGGQAAATGGSLMMVHQPRVVDFSGTAADLQKAVRVLDMMDAEVARIYSKRTGISAATWREAMRAERWFTADEAVAAGLVDYVL